MSCDFGQSSEAIHINVKRAVLAFMRNFLVLVNESFLTLNVATPIYTQTHRSALPLHLQADYTFQKRIASLEMTAISLEASK